MVDKEEKEKLTEALKEYIGEDVGDVDYCYGEDLQESGRRITIITKPHKPTFKEKRKELVDQLNKELKEIDDNYSVVKGIASPDVTYIHYDARPYCELYLNGNINFHGVYDSVKQMTKAMEAISGFSWELRQLKEQYKDETV